MRSTRSLRIRSDATSAARFGFDAVEVTVGPHVLRVREPTEDPVILALPPGRHAFRVRRGGDVLLEMAFDLVSGESRTLIADDERRFLDDAARPPDSPEGPGVGPAAPSGKGTVAGPSGGAEV